MWAHYEVIVSDLMFMYVPSNVWVVYSIVNIEFLVEFILIYGEEYCWVDEIVIFMVVGTLM